VDQVSVDWWDLLANEAPEKADLERLCHGVYPGYDPDISEGYREWFESEQCSITLRLTRLVGRHLGSFRDAGRWDLVELASQALLVLDPLSEEGTLARAEALAISGSKSAALSLIDEYLREVGNDAPHLRIAPSALKRRISERLPDLSHSTPQDRMFVGRDDTMRMLSAMGTTVRAGGQQVLLIWGEPGIGKTRLMTEYRALSALHGGVCQLASCQPHDVFRPLGVLCDLVTQLLQAPGALGCDPQARDLLGRLASVSAEVENVSDERSIETPLSAIVRSLADLVGSITIECPITVLIDDAQWLDRSSLRVILGAFAGRTAARCLVVMASRDRSLMAGVDTYSDSLLSMRLSPLEQAPARALAHSLLRSAALDEVDAIENLVLGQAQGNPFFIRLLCSHFKSTNDPASLRQTLTDILERRVEQLSREATRALEACVVLGNNCTYGRLEELLQMPRHDLLRAIEELDDRALVGASDGCFMRSHALLAEAVVRRMSEPVHRAMHSAAARLLQGESTPFSAGSLPWDCAEHFHLAGEDSNAIAVLRACAKRAIDIGRPSDALATLKRALTFEAPDEIRLEIVESALATLWFAINWADGIDLVPELKQLRGRLGRSVDPHDKFELLELTAAMHSDGDPRVNVSQLLRCLTSQDASREHKLCVARHLIAVAELTMDQRLANFAYEGMKELIPSSFWQALSDVFYHTCFGDATKVRELATALEKEIDLPRLIAVQLNIAYAQFRVGSCSEAERLAIQGLQVAQRLEILSAEMHCSLLLARLYWSLERIEESEKWHEHFASVLARNSDRDILWEFYVQGARLATRGRRYAEAQKYIDLARSCVQALLDLPRLCITACEIELRLAMGEESCSDEELREFLSLHLRARNLGCQDEVTLSLLRVLSVRGQTALAATLYESYVTTFRRDGFPIRTELAELGMKLASEGSNQCSGRSSGALANASC
jgi:tetratricopeptide (TPR) repeat protein